MDTNHYCVPLPGISLIIVSVAALIPLLPLLPVSLSILYVNMASNTTATIHPPLRAGILGATGAVGQRFIALLADHPGFRIQRLGASARSAGRAYNKAVVWRMNTPLPSYVANIVVTECVPEAFDDCDVIFSGLDASVAGDIELNFLAADHCVLSNAKNHRMAPDVPLVIPTVNIEHLHAIPAQRLLRGVKRGFLVTNSNCASTGVSVALKALQQQHGQDAIRQVNIVTMQAISGAGYPGVSAMDLMDNMVPHIGGEEDKLETEPLKILGTLHEGLLQVRDRVSAGDTEHAASLLHTIEPSSYFTPLTDCVISASCNRVAVLDGHTACVSVGLNPSTECNTDTLVTSAAAAFNAYTPPVSTSELACYSAPQPSIHVFEAIDRPQPRLDRDLGRGYAVSIDLKFVVLSHNTILGAAGSSILNAEAAYAMGYLTHRSSAS
ncbi:hypothetical protein BDF22DRAFT_671705 [Syncephalis plumigaleata]|nr:hypothetical protein BDF22DRAFT_671705 [Syncephalis plumigaleata]